MCHIGNAVSTDLFGCSSELLKNGSVFEKEDYEAVQDYYCCPSFILKITDHAVGSERDTHTHTHTQRVKYEHLLLQLILQTDMSKRAFTPLNHHKYTVNAHVYMNMPDQLIKQTVMKLTQ